MTRMRDPNLLELLQIYTDYIDLQRQTIDQLVAQTKKQAEYIMQLKTIAGCEDLKPDHPD